MLIPSLISYKFNSNRNDIRKKYVNYPKVGTILVAMHSGYTFTYNNIKEGKIKEGHITKGKAYVIIDNIDFTKKQLHVQSDEKDFYVLLTPSALKRFFNIKLKERSKCTKEELAVEDL